MASKVICSVAVGVALIGAAAAGTKSDMDPNGQWAARSGWGGGGGWGWGSDVSSGLVFVGLPLLLLIPLLFCLPYLLHSGHGHGGGWGWGGHGGAGGGGGYGRSDSGSIVQRKADQIAPQILSKL